MSKHSSTRVYAATKTQAQKNLAKHNVRRALKEMKPLTLPEYFQHIVNLDMEALKNVKG